MLSSPHVDCSAARRRIWPPAGPPAASSSSRRWRPSPRRRARARAPFSRLYTEGARDDADHADACARPACAARGDGLPVSIKDLFDVAGEVTSARSRVFEGNSAAKRTHRRARLRAAGAVFIGRNQHGRVRLWRRGLNPITARPGTRGTAAAGACRAARRRAPRSPSRRKCLMALGTDTRGSIRQPAALCGVAGFKPTARRVPRERCFPAVLYARSVGPSPTRSNAARPTTPSWPTTRTTGCEIGSKGPAANVAQVLGHRGARFGR